MERERHEGRKEEVQHQRTSGPLEVLLTYNTSQTRSSSLRPTDLIHHISRDLRSKWITAVKSRSVHKLGKFSTTELSPLPLKNCFEFLCWVSTIVMKHHYQNWWGKGFSGRLQSIIRETKAETQWNLISSPKVNDLPFLVDLQDVSKGLLLLT